MIFHFRKFQTGRASPFGSNSWIGFVVWTGEGGTNFSHKKGGFGKKEGMMFSKKGETITN